MTFTPSAPHATTCGNCGIRQDSIIDAARLQVVGPRSAPLRTSLTATDFLDLVRRSDLVTAEALDSLRAARSAGTLADNAIAYAEHLVAAGSLTHWQAQKLLDGRFKGFHLGPYRILEAIDHGSTNVAYLVAHRNLDRLMVLKVFPPQKPDAVRRTVNQVRTRAAVTHAGLAPVFDCSEGDGAIYVLQELVHGVPLAEACTVFSHVQEIQAVFVQIGAVLQHCHENGLRFLNLCPWNVLLTQRGIVRIVSLGTSAAGAPVLGSRDDRSAFVAPEVHHGAADDRSDIFSVGATLRHLLSGSRTKAIEYDTGLRRLSQQLTRPDPSHRVQSAAALVGALDQCLRSTRR